MVWGIEIEHSYFQLKLRSYHPKSRPPSINNISLGAKTSLFFACSIVMKNIIIMKVIVNNYVFILLNS